MSPHRQHYMDLQASKPARKDPLADAATPPLPAWAMYALVALVLAAQLLFTLYQPKPTVVITPIREPQAQQIEVPPPVDVEDARVQGRIEGFQAGVATVTEEGCPLPLSAPVNGAR